MRGESLAIGTELKELVYDNDADWWIKFYDVGEMFKYEPTYVIAHFLFLGGGLLTLLHALSHGGRMPFLWLATIGHGLVIECMAYFVPNVDNFWHSLTPIVLLGRRLPIHIIFLYPCFIYNAMAGVSKLRLPRWAEPFAVGLCSVLVDIPYDIVSVKFAHWTWHDTDPNIYDRHYWVPWNSYYFHATFAAGFTFWFHNVHSWLGGRYEERWTRNSYGKELLTTILASFLGAPTGILMFMPLYHPLHDIFKIHSEVTFFVLFIIFLTLAWSGDRTPKDGARPAKGERVFSWKTFFLLTHLVVHYSSWLAMVLFANPEDEVATGLHETIGPCNEMVDVHTFSGMVLQRRRYLCLKDYDEKYFDFHCLPGGKPPSSGASWYTICGTPFENRMEYIVVVAGICILAFGVWTNLHFRSGPESILSGRKVKSHNKQEKVKKK